MKENIQKYLKETKQFSAEQIIVYAAEQFGNKITFASSLGEEDQILTDMIAKNSPGISIFTLDTGRLYPESYDLISKTQQKYNIPIQIYFPNAKDVENMVAEKGVNLFYDSVENRKLCCGIRKIEPLKRALNGKKAWITGLRRSQSVTRSQNQVFEWDEPNQLIKVNPLADWSYEQVEKYIEQHKIEINPLHKKGFVSIGCAPCTRAIQPGEDIRSGRWWWENPESKECGLHNNSNRPKAN